MLTPRSPLKKAADFARLEALSLGLLAFILALVFASNVFSWQEVTGDEGSYLFQAHCFLDGVVKRDCPVFYPLLKYDMIILDPDKGWVSRYPLGHPLWLLPGIVLGIPHLMSAVAGAVSVMCAYAIGWRLRFPRFLLPGMMLLSPFFLFMHGTLLSHTSGLATVSVMFLAYLIWRQERQPVWAVVAGLAWAFYFTNRTWTALLIAVPFGLDCLFDLKRNMRSKATWLGTVLFAASAGVGLLVYMGYNALVTGDSGMPTYLYYEESEKLGFGKRRTQGGPGYMVDHSFRLGVKNMWGNLLLLDRWMFGVPYTMLVWCALVVHGWSRRWTPVALGACISVAAGYIYFWYPGITDVGPVYYTELLIFLLLLFGFGLSRIWRRSETKPRRRLVLFSLLAGLQGIVCVAFCLQETERIRSGLSTRVEMANALATVSRDALVFAGPVEDRYLHHYIGLNPRGLDSDPLILRSRGLRDHQLAALFPGRTPWRMEWTNGVVNVSRMVYQDVPMAVEATATYKHRRSAENRGNVRVSDAAAGHVEGLMCYGWYNYLPAGRYELRVNMRWEDVSPDQPVELELAADLGRKIVFKQTLSTDLVSTTIPFELETLQEVEPRVRYGGSGLVTLSRLEIIALDDTTEP